MLCGLSELGGVDLTAVVNVGDDDTMYGMYLSPDLDTVTYTLAGVASLDRGWGREDESWNTMEELERFPIDTLFRLGDRDLALNLFRTARMADGTPLSEVTREITSSFGIQTTVLPASDDPIRTRVRIAGEWVDFQDYFVRRRHAEPIERVRFDGAAVAKPAPGVLEAIAASDAVVIGPSNPILSIWPVLAIPGLADAVAATGRVVGVNPLIGGSAVKGPLAEVMTALGFPPSTDGILRTYDGLLTDLVVQPGDEPATAGPVLIHSSDIHIARRDDAGRLAASIVQWLH